MLKQIIRLRVSLVLLLGALLFCSIAFAQDSYTSKTTTTNNNGDVTTKTTTTDNSGNVTSQSTVVKHYYRDGRWYRRDTTGNETSVLDVVVGALVGALPPQSTTVVYQDTPYYYDNRHYYKQLPNGDYVVVEAPRR